MLPATPAPGPLEWALIVLAVISFGLVAIVQAMFPLWAYHPAAAGLRVHLSNGFYANAVFDRLLGGWSSAQRVLIRSGALKNVYMPRLQLAGRSEALDAAARSRRPGDPSGLAAGVERRRQSVPRPDG